MSKIAEDIKPITYLKTHSAELVNSVVSRRASVVITQNGEPRVIVQDIQSFEKDRKALLLLKLISQGVLDAEAGDLIEQDVLFDRLEKKLLKTASR
ncbi:MAG: type II toxin-antitoxin system Phd/YefM family antitoxin [Deltaproteobacteria bacterium]|nr:type II toxin-antitoxin system Phd/YefM family antitoxin [Deltaproteobacteria bacterium]MBI4373344.1 type II toxin-antitoxin system Phd/YefM family antitoxin [Deltaproteobacteria bacterium]